MRILERQVKHFARRTDNGRFDFKDETVAGAQDGTELTERDGTADCYYAIRRLIEFAQLPDGLNNESENRGRIHTMWSEHPSQFVEALRRLFLLTFDEGRHLTNSQRFQMEITRFNNLISNVAGINADSINPTNPNSPIANSNQTLRTELDNLIRDFEASLADLRTLTSNVSNNWNGHRYSNMVLAGDIADRFTQLSGRISEVWQTLGPLSNRVSALENRMEEIPIYTTSFPTRNVQWMHIIPPLQFGNYTLRINSVLTTGTTGTSRTVVGFVDFVYQDGQNNVSLFLIWEENWRDLDVPNITMFRSAASSNRGSLQIQVPANTLYNISIHRR